jgi:hypothetical protein
VTSHLEMLPDRWRSEAKILRTNGAEGIAKAKERDAAELEQALREHELEELTPREASTESGYTEGHLSRLQRDGILRNVGDPGHPRYRRCDLPRKVRRASIGLEAA